MVQAAASRTSASGSRNASTARPTSAGDLRDQLVPAVLGYVERDGHLRSRPLRLEEQDVLRPEHVLLHRRRAAFGLHVGQIVLDFDLTGVSDRQTAPSVRNRSLIVCD